MPAANANNYVNSFLPLQAGLFPDSGDLWSCDGKVYGVRADGALMRYVGAAEKDGETEAYYLFFGVNSLHSAVLTGKGDDAALRVAQVLLDHGA